MHSYYPKKRKDLKDFMCRKPREEMIFLNGSITT